jgi:NAD(P)H-quinone oxidoreductase subunit K
MKVVDDILDGKYLSVPGRIAPPKELTEAMGMPVPPALLAGQKQEVNRG